MVVNELGEWESEREEEDAPLSQNSPNNTDQVQ